MKRAILPLLLPVLLLLSSLLQANEPVRLIREYIKVTYDDRLRISDSQIRQLSWVIDNPFGSPELSAKKTPEVIHREVPRALARLYALQRLRSGTSKDYEAFIEPQKSFGKEVLKKSSFDQLSALIKGLDDDSYDTLEAAAIISAVTLSPTARERASFSLKSKLPQDSTKFLSLTALKAKTIYPLAKEIITKYKTDGRKFQIVFLPDSHLRHMMYNEGSLSMYSTFRKGFKDHSLNQKDLNLWYAHWVANIAGFRGHLSPVGSLYLTENTYRAMNQVKVGLDELSKNPRSNPMNSYLHHRADWLRLSETMSEDKRLALASMAASFRLFSPEDGRMALKAFNKLSANDQKRWITHTKTQLTETGLPAPTYAPALFANALELSNLADTIQKTIPLFLNAIDEEHRLRKEGKLPLEVPISFRQLASAGEVSNILKADQVPGVVINLENGLIALHQPLPKKVSSSSGG